MEERMGAMNEIIPEHYDAADRPFDFVETDADTAIICESDATTREKLSSAVKSMGYLVTEALRAKDALKSMRFHLYDMVVINENFDHQESSRNDILAYLETLAMSMRRQIFVVLITDTCRTMDNMAAFNRSVNVTINLKNIDDAGTILRAAVADNAAFYRVMKETLRKMGRA